MRLAFIGGGVMAEAIIGGVLSARLASPETVSVGEPVAERREHLAQTHGVAVFADNATAITRRRPHLSSRQAPDRWRTRCQI